MTEARLAASLKIVGGIFLLVALALLLWWARAHDEMNHAGFIFVLGAVFAGLVGAVFLVMGLAARPDETQPPRV